jgi:hypothetical protein
MFSELLGLIDTIASERRIGGYASRRFDYRMVFARVGVDDPVGAELQSGYSDCNNLGCIGKSGVRKGATLSKSL